MRMGMGSMVCMACAGDHETMLTIRSRPSRQSRTLLASMAPTTVLAYL